MNKICIIVCYIGKFPDYFDYFISSCINNPTIDFLIFNDCIKNDYINKNITFKRLSLQEFNNLSSRNLNLSINLRDSWKINELKPAFGVIFKDYLKKYDFWAWADLDLIFGKIRHFLTDEILNSFDVISTKEHWTAGHFCLFKNNEKCNTMFTQSPNYQSIFTSDKYTAFEESCHRWDGDIFSIQYLTENNMLVSMFDLVKNLANLDYIKLLLKDNIREYPQAINYIYSNGKLFDKTNNQEFFYYHLHTIKKIWRFYIPQWKDIPNEYIITSMGIQKVNEGSGVSLLFWKVNRLKNILPKIYKSIQNQTTMELIRKIFYFLPAFSKA